jgi:hypothetical protein
MSEQGFNKCADMDYDRHVSVTLTYEEIAQCFAENQRKVEDDQENGYEPEQIVVNEQQICGYIVILRVVLEVLKIISNVCKS